MNKATRHSAAGCRGSNRSTRRTGKFGLERDFQGRRSGDMRHCEIVWRSSTASTATTMPVSIARTTRTIAPKDKRSQFMCSDQISVRVDALSHHAAVENWHNRGSNLSILSKCLRTYFSIPSGQYRVCENSVFVAIGDALLDNLAIHQPRLYRRRPDGAPSDKASVQRRVPGVQAYRRRRPPAPEPQPGR